MKLLSVVKDRWNNIDEKEFFHVATNFGTYGRCDSSISGAGNAPLLDVRKNRAKINLLILIEQ